MNSVQATFAGLVSAIAVSAALGAQKPISTDSVEVVTLHRFVAEAPTPGVPGSLSLLRMRDKSGCEWIVKAALDPHAHRIMGRAEVKVCGSIEYSVDGYLVGADDLTGLPIACHDLWSNKAGSIRCQSAAIPAGTPGRVVVQAN